MTIFYKIIEKLKSTSINQSHSPNKTDTHSELEDFLKKSIAYFKKCTLITKYYFRMNRKAYSLIASKLCCYLGDLYRYYTNLNENSNYLNLAKKFYIMAFRNNPKNSNYLSYLGTIHLQEVFSKI